ncbi:ABC transporter substrate-binding protein [Rhodothermus profundi]|uniref:Carbohydrate ABC transporter substrate-binding protein, CUT1 family n=1 Tax=Rhodothermus profundi TaxID=633813 RepID=A0A1M6XAH7_9BACT|nr:sugar ABC transporter substrate-binding protein [Rhodothermus profundi]SHL02928.1 carbohydrate ABC transporter substrate-binding protein, CUT1 family [Rhodothermus profundi]
MAGNRTPAHYVGGCVLISALLLMGCHRPTPPSTAAGGGIRLVYWTAPNPDELALARELVAEWQAAHPEVEVVVQPIPAGQSSEEVLLAAVAAGTTPDLCSNIWPGIVEDFVEAGALVPLDRFSDFDSLWQSRIPETVRMQFRSRDGHFYQFPWKTNPVMMFYNVQLLQEAGFEQPPRTYREYLEAARRITADTDGDGTIDRWMGYRDIRPIWWQRYFDYYAFYVAASGGRTLFDGQGQLALDTAASNRVFAFFARLYAMGAFPKAVWTSSGSRFLNGQLATDFTGSWHLVWLEKHAPAELVYEVAPLPVPDDHEGPVYTYGDYKNMVIFSTTQHPEIAWSLLRFLVSRQADRRLLERTRQIPVRRGLLDDPYFAPVFEQQPLLRRFAEQAAYTRSVDSVPDLKEILDALAQEFEAAAVYGIRSPAEATRRALRRIRMILNWNA